MRLLNTWTGEFEWHSDPKKVRYAILSHVWRTPEAGGEQSYDDVCRIQASARTAPKGTDGSCAVDWPQLSHRDDTSPSDNLYTPTLHGVSVIFSQESPLSNKLKGLCKVARVAGFDLVWNDTCCIDKSSSAELSEAINSMYEWYRLSDMCYVYLADVPDGEIPSANLETPFQESRWHRRGWTLQELIAPEYIEFLTSGWSVLGTKQGLVFTLYEITRIDVNILLGRAAVESASVAARMSWAAKRRTTRIEDRAYSLMGLFGVHMSPIYGEGTNAFLRLQEEVIRTIPDQSIFSWSATPYDYDQDCHDARVSSCLLASSPESFSYSDGKPIALRLSEFASRLTLKEPEVPPLDCTFAPQGVRIRLLCVNLTEVRQCLPRLRQRHDWCPDNPSVNREADRLALLQCETEDQRLVGLAFHSSDAVGDGLGCLVGDRCACSANGSSRTIRLSREELAAILEVATPEMAEVSLLRYPSDPPPSKSLLRIDSLSVLNLWFTAQPDFATFSLSPQSVASLRTLGFKVIPLRIKREKDKITLKTALVWRHGGLLHSIPLRISLETRIPGRSVYDARFCLSAAPLSSPGLASSLTASTFYPATGLEVPSSYFEQIQDADIYDVEHRSTLAQFDLLIRPYPLRPQKAARILRLSLKRTPQGRQPSAPNSSSTVFLVMNMSEEYHHISKPRSLLNVVGDITNNSNSAFKQNRTLDFNSDSECSSLREYSSDSEELCDPDIDDWQAPLTSLGPSLSIKIPEPATAHSERMNMEETPHVTAGSQADSSSMSPALRTPSGGYIRNPDEDDAFQGGTVLGTRSTADETSNNGPGGSVPPRRGDVTQIPDNIVLEIEAPIAPLAPAPVERLTEIGRSGSGIGAPENIASMPVTTEDASSPRASGAPQRAAFEQISTTSTVPEAVRKRRRSASAHAEPPECITTKRARMSRSPPASRAHPRTGNMDALCSKMDGSSGASALSHRDDADGQEDRDREYTGSTADQQPAELSDPIYSAEMSICNGGAHASPSAPYEPSAAAVGRAYLNPLPSGESLPPPVSLLPSHLPDVVSDLADATTAQYATLESVEALRRENSALRTQVSTAALHHAELRSEVAALTRKNAALVSQMAAVLQKFEALATTAGK